MTTSVKSFDMVKTLDAFGFKDATLPSDINLEQERFVLTLSRTVNVAWYGKQVDYLDIDVVLDKYGCFASFSTGKQKYYETKGKRTWNAIVDTIHNAGFEF